MADLEIVYDPLQSPPNMELAELHGRASRVGKLKREYGQETCICCGLSSVKFLNIERRIVESLLFQPRLPAYRIRVRALLLFSSLLEHPTDIIILDEPHQDV